MRDCSRYLHAAGVVLVASAVAAGSGTINARADSSMRVVVEGGNIVLLKGSTRKSLTTSKRDSEAVLSPDGLWVVYTRSAKAVTGNPEDEAGDCASLSAPDELRRVRADGSGDELLIRGRAGSEPSQALCAFRNKQFTSSGTTIFFLSPAWTTSNALNAFDLDTRTARHIMPANDFGVLSWCTSDDLRDAIIAQQHRYFRFGGSYDWYWLFDPTGKKEISPVGEFADMEAVKSDLDASGQCGS